MRSFLVVVVAMIAAPAGATLIGVTPESAVAHDGSGGSVQVDVLGFGTGVQPPAGSAIVGSIGPQDDVIFLRFTNVGVPTITLVGVAVGPSASIPTAVGDMPGGVRAPNLGYLPTAEPVKDSLLFGFSLAPGEFIDTFFAFSGLVDGEEILAGGVVAFGFTPAAATVLTVQVPEPGAWLPLLMAAAWLVRQGFAAPRRSPARR